MAAAAGLDWPQTEARAAGFDGDRLQALRDKLEKHQTRALVILRGGRKVLEWYAPGVSAGTKQGTASLAKALVGGTSLLVATNDGLIRSSDRAAKYIPAWANDPLKAKITIRQLATHTSGIQDSSVEGVTHGQEPTWQGAFWRREPDPFSVAIRDAPVIFEPGTSNQYSNPGMAALAYAVTASLRSAPQTDIKSLLRERVFRLIGLTDEQWSIGYGRAYQVDGLDLYANWGGGAFTPRATARIGEWMMRLGQWDGKAVVREGAIRQALTYAGMPLPDRKKEPFAPGSGLAWYTNFDSVWPAVPRDAFAGAGAQHEVLLVVPSLELVVVRNGGSLSGKTVEDFWGPVYRYLFEPVMAALGYPAKPAAVPYPASKVIHRVTFEETVVRQAVDSDNWPLTWGDDDAIYTAYGDGHGFEPFVKEKLSNGLAKVEGGPDDFRGVNIRSETGETRGDGRNGAKASGMLMVDGVLYMWLRNRGNAQLAWSADHARTWETGFKLEQSFGSPAFLNFGRNYAGAPDDYVYAYSQDGPSAYEINDGVVLARAPRKRLRDGSAWEFFAGAAAKSSARWSRDVAERQPVFRFPKHCQRVDAVYHPVLKRYLLLVGYGHTGGWGLYEGPKPWGPWAVAFHTEYWGLGETHGYRLPAKWISKDGRSAALVFSGLIYNGIVYDAFCVRKMRLEI
jgi:CubicO group peptidase (beta-lactamase class C family)